MIYYQCGIKPFSNATPFLFKKEMSASLTTPEVNKIVGIVSLALGLIALCVLVIISTQRKLKIPQEATSDHTNDHIEVSKEKNAENEVIKTDAEGVSTESIDKEKGEKESVTTKSNAQCLPSNIQQLIERQFVSLQSVKNKLQANFKPKNYILPMQFDPILPAIVNAEKTRLYFNSKGIPVGFTARGFEDYVMTSLLKNLNPLESLSKKRFKPFVYQAKEDMLFQKDSPESMKKIFCLSSNLYDTDHGESYFYFLLEGSLSFMPKSQSDYRNQIHLLCKKNKLNNKIAEKIYSLYCEYNQKLKNLQASRILYTIAFTDLNQNHEIFRFSKSYGDSLYTLTDVFLDINKRFLKYNKKTSIQEQNQDCPQIRAIKPAINKDNGMRVFRCYKSEDQRKIHKEFKNKLQKILQNKLF